MTWFAVRTSPGAQMPQREFVLEKTDPRRDKDGNPISKGYRIVPTINNNLSAIERVLIDVGIDFYMPSERRLVRDRRRPYLWKAHRRALIVGYLFVRDPDWSKLIDLPGIAGVVGIGGNPLKIDFFDILKVYEAEMKELIKFQEDSRSARQQLRKLAKKDPAVQKIVEKLDIAGTITVPIAEVREAAA